MYSCPLCGEVTMQKVCGTFRMDPPQNIPGGAIEIPDATWEECSACEELILSAELEGQLDEVRYHRLGLLRPTEIMAVRERAGLSQTAMAQFVGAGEKTYNRWESGRSIQNKSSDNLIRLADQFPELFIQLEAQRDPQRQERISTYVRGLFDTTGANNLAIAAHGAEFDLTLAEELRHRLRLFASKGKDEK